MSLYEGDQYLWCIEKIDSEYKVYTDGNKFYLYRYGNRIQEVNNIAHAYRLITRHIG